MSKLVKGVGKLFKKAGKIVKKVARAIGKGIKKYGKWIALAVAVYFTAGAALAYFGAATLPGFAVAGVGGSTTTGIFAKVAGKLGMDAVAAGGKAALAASGGSAASGAASILSPGAQSAFLAGGTGGSGILAPAAQSSFLASAPAAAAKTGWWAGLDSTGKLMAIQAATSFAGNLMTPKPEREKDKIAARNQNALGIGRKGTGPGAIGGFNEAFGDLTQGQEQFVSSPENTPPGETPSGQYNIPQFQNQNLNLMQGSGDFFKPYGPKIAS